MSVQVDMQIADVHSLLQLPGHELDAGCNLTLASLLFALTGGTSVMFFEAELSYFKKRPNTGPRFKKLLKEFYLWQSDDEPREMEASKLLYVWARNPLTHSFGIGKAAQLFPGAPTAAARPLWLYKWPLSREQADMVIDGEPTRPPFLPPTLKSGVGGIEVSVPTLAWGTLRMLRDLFSDELQARRAEILAGQLLEQP